MIWMTAWSAFWFVSQNVFFSVMNMMSQEDRLINRFMQLMHTFRYLTFLKKVNREEIKSSTTCSLSHIVTRSCSLKASNIFSSSTWSCKTLTFSVDSCDAFSFRAFTVTWFIFCIVFLSCWSSVSQIFLIWLR